MAETRGIEPHPDGPSVFKTVPIPDRMRLQFTATTGRAVCSIAMIGYPAPSGSFAPIRDAVLRDRSEHCRTALLVVVAKEKMEEGSGLEPQAFTPHLFSKQDQYRLSGLPSNG